MLFDIVEGWNEHLNDGLESFADIPRDVLSIANEGWNEHLNDGLESFADIPRDVLSITNEGWN